MRILSIVPFSPPSPQHGGAERQAHSLHKGLMATGLEVHVLADIEAVGRSFQIFEGIPVHGVPFPVLTSHPLRPGNLKFWMAWRTIRRTVLTQIPRPDLIQVTTFRQSAMVGHWLAKTLNVPWVVRLACSGLHGDMRFARNNWLSRRELPRMTRAVSAVVAIDNQTRSEAIEHGVPRDRIELIPNGLVLRRCPNGSMAHESLVFVGRLDRQKRVDTLLAAYRKLQEGGPPPPRLVIAGEGAEKSHLEQLAGDLAFADRCTFLGRVSGPEDVLEGASCFVNPSESEGLPNAVLEALAFGVPVLLSDIPVHRELAAAVGMEEFLFAVGDAHALAASLRRFLDLKDIDKESFRRRCIEYAQQFTTAARDAAFLRLYRRIINRT